MNPIKILKRGFLYLAVIAVSVAVILPFLLMITYSLRSSSDIFALDIKLLPSHPSLDSYRSAILEYRYSGTGFLDWGLNSLLACGIATILSMFFAATCGYAITRFKFTGKSILWFVIVLTQTIPWIVILIPYYITLAGLGLVNNLWSLCATYLAVFMPTSTWLFVGFFGGIPIEIEEAARIDGCGAWGIFFRVVLPLSGAAVSAIALVTFVSGWGDYLFASVLLKSAGNWTIPLGLQSFRGEHTIRWSEIMAMSALITVPIVVLFIYLQRHLVSLMAGGVKQ
ncbi:MAG: carbohydrate ABC transporter permease [Methanomassiliicoccales archaeon]|nr:carbohydrate ABC transporter permease [Methanomassiliicoccales archaeon]